MAETLANRAAIANSTLVWCGVTDPTPTQFEIASLAADAAIDTIREYRGLNTARIWRSEQDYVLNEVVQATPATGTLYRCVTAGTSDTDQPTWVLGVDETTFTDGTVEWEEYVRPFEARFTSLAVEMAVYLYSKRGADGASSYGENGVQRSFEKGSFPPSMLGRIPLGVLTG